MTSRHHSFLFPFTLTNCFFTSSEALVEGKSSPKTNFKIYWSLSIELFICSFSFFFSWIIDISIPFSSLNTGSTSNFIYPSGTNSSVTLSYKFYYTDISLPLSLFFLLIARKLLMLKRCFLPFFLAFPEEESLLLGFSFKKLAKLILFLALLPPFLVRYALSLWHFLRKGVCEVIKLVRRCEIFLVICETV